TPPCEEQRPGIRQHPVVLDDGQTAEKVLVLGFRKIFCPQVPGILQEITGDLQSLRTGLGRDQPAALCGPVVAPGPSTPLVPGCWIDILALAPHPPCDPVLPSDRLDRRRAADDQHPHTANVSGSDHCRVRLLEKLEESDLQPVRIEIRTDRGGVGRDAHDERTSSNGVRHTGHFPCELLGCGLIAGVAWAQSPVGAPSTGLLLEVELSTLRRLLSPVDGPERRVDGVCYRVDSEHCHDSPPIILCRALKYDYRPLGGAVILFAPLKYA